MGGWSLIEVTLVLAVLFAVQAFLLLPFTRRRLAKVEDSGKPRWAVIVLMVETAQLMLLAALISAVATLAVLWFLTRGAGTSSMSVAKAIDQIEAIKEWIGTASFTLWLWVFVLATIGLFWWIVRRRKAQFEQARAALMQDEFNRLLNEFNEGVLPPLEPTAAMKELISRVEALNAHDKEITQRVAAAETEADRMELTRLHFQLDSERKATLERLLTVDLLRRIEIPAHDPDLIGLPPPPRTFLEKAGRIFISRGMFRHLGLGQRALLVLSLLVLVPSLLALKGTAIIADLEARLSSLDALRVNLVAQESELRFEAASKIAPPESDDADDVDDETFSDIAQTHAQAFERTVARNLSARYLPNETGEAAKDARSALRQSVSEATHPGGNCEAHQLASRRFGHWFTRGAQGRGSWNEFKTAQSNFCCRHSRPPSSTG